MLQNSLCCTIACSLFVEVVFDKFPTRESSKNSLRDMSTRVTELSSVLQKTVANSLFPASNHGKRPRLMHVKIAARLHQLGSSTQIMTIMSCMYLRFDRSANLRLRESCGRSPGNFTFFRSKQLRVIYTCYTRLKLENKK
jgi:hypothetical protein